MDSKETKNGAESPISAEPNAAVIVKRAGGLETSPNSANPAANAGVFIKKSAAKFPSVMPVGGGAVKISGSPVKMTASVSYEMPAGFKPIERNIYVGRSEVKLRPHELPRCSCKPEQSCSPSICENATVFIECSPERCSLGKSCKNQRFQRRQYAGIRPQRCGRKGWGIFATLPISRGQFVIEYVGEVIDAEELEKRSQDCANDPHYYFLSLTGGETIDASKKGNVSRFINHSCDPNCITQKWQINGESRVGIFALRNIKVGEELTFDYQFERFGMKKQRCLCGAANCSKYLGSKPKPKDGERIKKRRHEKVVYSEVSEAILPDEHVLLVLDDQPVNTFPFSPVDERWYYLPEADIPRESDTEDNSSDSSDDSDSDTDDDDDGNSTTNEAVSEDGPPAKVSKLAEGDTPHSSTSGSTSTSTTTMANYTIATSSPSLNSSVTSAHPQHCTRDYVNKVPGRPPLFRRSSAYKQRLILLDTYTSMFYDAVDNQKERKSLMQDAELAVLSSLTGVDPYSQTWMASLDIKQLMKDGLLEFSPPSAADRAQMRRANLRSKRLTCDASV